MKVLQVPEMHCMNCVNRINKAMEEEGIAHQVNLEEKTVAVDEGKVKEAVELLDDLGFSAEEA